MVEHSFYYKIGLPLSAHRFFIKLTLLLMKGSSIYLKVEDDPFNLLNTSKKNMSKEISKSDLIKNTDIKYLNYNNIIEKLINKKEKYLNKKEKIFNNSAKESNIYLNKKCVAIDSKLVKNKYFELLNNTIKNSKDNEINLNSNNNTKSINNISLLNNYYKKEKENKEILKDNLIPLKEELFIVHIIKNNSNYNLNTLHKNINIINLNYLINSLNNNIIIEKNKFINQSFYTSLIKNQDLKFIVQPNYLQSINILFTKLNTKYLKQNKIKIHSSNNLYLNSSIKYKIDGINFQNKNLSLLNNILYSNNKYNLNSILNINFKNETKFITRYKKNVSKFNKHHYMIKINDSGIGLFYYSNKIFLKKINLTNISNENIFFKELFNSKIFNINSNNNTKNFKTITNQNIYENNLYCFLNKINNTDINKYLINDLFYFNKYNATNIYKMKNFINLLIELPSNAFNMNIQQKLLNKFSKSISYTNIEKTFLYDISKNSIYKSSINKNLHTYNIKRFSSLINNIQYLDKFINKKAELNNSNKPINIYFNKEILKFNDLFNKYITDTTILNLRKTPLTHYGNDITDRFIYQTENLYLNQINKIVPFYKNENLVTIKKYNNLLINYYLNHILLNNSKINLINNYYNKIVLKNISNFTINKFYNSKIIKEYYNTQIKIFNEKILDGNNINKIDIKHDLLYLSLNKRWWFLRPTNPKIKIDLPYIDYPYETNPVLNENTSPIPEFKNLGKQNLPVSIEIVVDVVNIVIHWWHHSYSDLANAYGTEGIQGLMDVIYQWFMLETSQKELEDKGSYADYTRTFRWLRWEAERIYFMAKNDYLNCKKDPENNVLYNSNVYMGKYVSSLLSYLKYHYYYLVPIFDGVSKMDSIRAVLPSDDPQGNIIKNVLPDKIIEEKDYIFDNNENN